MTQRGSPREDTSIHLPGRMHARFGFSRRTPVLVQETPQSGLEDPEPDVNQFIVAFLHHERSHSMSELPALRSQVEKS